MSATIKRVQPPTVNRAKGKATKKIAATVDVAQVVAVAAANAKAIDLATNIQSDVSASLVSSGGAIAPNTPAIASVPSGATTITSDVPQVPVLSRRQQLTAGLGTDISFARVRKHIDALGLNEAITVAARPYKAIVAEYDALELILKTGLIEHNHVEIIDGKNKKIREMIPLPANKRAEIEALLPTMTSSYNDAKARVKILGKIKTRFANEAAPGLGFVLDEMIQQLAQHTMANTLRREKKIIKIEHVHDAGIEKLAIYPLIRRLPSFVANSTFIANKNATEDNLSKEAALLARAERDFRKKYGLTVKKVAAPAGATTGAGAGATTGATHTDTPAPIVPPAPAVSIAEVDIAAAPEEEEESAKDSKMSFKFYAGLVCRKVIDNDLTYTGIRISTEVREYFSDLAVEFIRSIAPIVHLVTLSMKNKTVNDRAILRAVEIIMVEGHRSEDHIEWSMIDVPVPAALEAEKKKKAEAKAADPKSTYQIDFAGLPTVNCLVATKVESYPTCGYAQLEKKILGRLEVYKALHAAKPGKEKVEGAEESDDEPGASDGEIL